jgi:hypothetical protein
VPERARANRRRDALRPWLVAVVLVSVASFLPGVTASSTHASGYPPLPVLDGRQFLGNLSAPSLTAGTSGPLSFTVANPLPSTLVGALVTFQVYAFNAFPGNATSTVPVAGAPLLSYGPQSGAIVNLSVGSLGPGSVFHGSVGVDSSTSTPSGTFAVRSSLSFTANGTAYLLESRGWFTSSAWAAATELPNGSVTLNLTRLGVSGVLPETAVYVSSSGFDWALGALAAAGIVLVGAGAWVYFRRGPGSSSGTR